MSLYEQNFFPEYKPLVFNTHLPKAAEVLRGRYDANMEAKSILDRAMGSVRTLNPIEQAKINQAKDDIEQKIAGRVDFENMGKIITDSTTRFLTDHRVLDAMDSYAVRQKEREMEDTLRVQGKTPLDFNAPVLLDKDGKAVIDPVTNAPVRRHKTEDWDSETKGIYRMAVEEKLPWDVKAAQLIQGIQSDTKLMQKAIMSGVDPKEVNMWLMQKSELSKEKKDAVASLLVNEFRSSSEGNQMFRDLTQLKVNPVTGSVYTEKEAEKEMLGFLEDIGQKQVGYNYNYSPARFDPDAGKVPAPIIPDPLTLVEEMPSKEIDRVTASKELTDKFNTDGSVKESKSIWAEPKISKRTKEKESQLVNDSFNWGDTTDVDIVRMAMSDNVITKNFPRKADETDLAYTKRFANILRSRTTSRELVPTFRPAAAELAEMAVLRGVIYQENGSAYDNLEKWLEDVDEFFTYESTIRDALFNSINAEKEGKTVNGQMPGITSMIMSGKHAGRLKHTFSVGGKNKQIILSPVAGMERSGTVMRAIAEMESSLNPEKKMELDLGEHGVLELRNRPAKSGERIETTLIDNGQELDPKRVYELQKTMLMQMWGTSGTLLQKAFTFTAEKNERP
jgi:hypothetical protein